MVKKPKQKGCFFCEESFDKEELEDSHIIPIKRGGCDCEPNLVKACRECIRSKNTLTPIEWWAKQQWENDFKKKRGKSLVRVSMFDAGCWTLEERQHHLMQWAYWEARARWHMMTEHKDKKLPNWGRDKGV